MDFPPPISDEFLKVYLPSSRSQSFTSRMKKKTKTKKHERIFDKVNLISSENDDVTTFLFLYPPFSFPP